MATDDGDFSIAAEAEVERHFRWARWLVTVIVLLVLIAGTAFWILRKSVAERTLAGWCASHDLVCAAQFDRLGADGATVSNLAVSGGGKLAFEASEVRVDLDWPGLFKPRVTSIQVGAPVVHGELADGRLGFHGLEKLASTGGEGGGTLPAIDIRDGRILVATSAGEVSASVSVSGTFPRDGKATLVLDPASLDEKQGYVRWTGGTAEIVAADGQLEGRADLVLEEVRTDEVTVSNAALTASLEAGLGEGDPARLVWEGQVEQASGADFGLSGLTTSGQARLASLAELSQEALFAALTEADVQMESSAAHWMEYETGSARVEASLRGRDGVFAGPVELALADVSLPQGGRAGGLETAGELDWSKESGFDYGGRVSLSKVSLTEQLTGGALKALALPSPLVAHGDSLQAAFRKAASDFNAVARVSVQASDRKLRVTGKEEASLIAASGLTLAISPRSGEDWLTVDGGKYQFAGALSLKGGGAPHLTAEVASLSIGKGEVSLSTGPVNLSPWKASGVRFGADISSSELRIGEGEFAMTGAGALTLSGPVFGLDLEESRLRGGIEVSQANDGLKVEPMGQPCLVFDTKGLVLGGVDFQPETLRLCPKAGVFMKPGRGGATGTASLGDVSWPFASKSVTGTLGLRNASLDWSLNKGFAFTISSPSLDLPLDIDTRTLTIAAENPRVSLRTAKGQVPSLSATLAGTVLGGTLVPANVSAETVTFEGQIGSGGLSGDLAGGSVLIRDFREDPVYQPLLSDLTARMDEWQLALSGPLRLQESDVPVGDITADVNVLSLNGTARVASRPLDFRKGGLQPVMLSERLRGVYTDAAGRLEAASDVVLTGGKLAGTADITATDFGFQTTRLGRVRNVNGHVRFADLFSLTTEPSQVLTIGEMNPGVPLKDGRIVFRFSDGKVISVDSAAFPFSGGTLALSPFEWTLGGETQHVEVTADAIDLKELVSTLKLPKIEAEGTVSGRFPIDVERSKVLIRNARLFADPGGGRVAYLGDAADSAAQSDANVRLAFEALKDFDFTVLEVGLDGNVADRVKITLKLSGKSRNDIAYGSNANIVRGQPFEFNIGIDSALAELFRSSQFYTNQQKLTDFVVKEVLTENGLKTAEDE
ncbi:MAG: YdbH domain-containing protein [Hyphomonas sp.]